MADPVVKAATPEEITQAMERAARVTAEQEREKLIKPPEKAPPKFVNGNRSITVELEYPLEYDNVTYQKITVRRPTIGEWRAYLDLCHEAVEKYGKGADDNVDQPWLSAPIAVINSLDWIDGGKFEEAQANFFASLPSTVGTQEPPKSPSESSTGEPSP